MKKATLFLTILTLLAFTGCKEEAVSLIEDGKQSIDNLVEEASDVVDKFNETAEDIKAAATEIKEAKDAISEITQ